MKNHTVVRGLNAPKINAPGLAAGQTSAVEQRLSETQWRWVALVALVMTAMLYFVRLGARALWASEFRWAEIAREMLLTHDYFWPTINGRVYFDKPLGSYWLVFASTWITGRMDEAAARIPCAAAGVLAVALLILLARRLYNLQTGVAAGFILATSLSFVFWARTASADIETIAGELAALLIFKNNANGAGWWIVPMWLVMAVTSLMKGLLGFVLPLLVIGVYSCLAGGWLELGHRMLHGPLGLRIRWLIERNRWFFNWRTIVAVVFAAIVYGGPFAISHARTGSAKGIYMVYRENVERYFAPFDHRGPIYLYVYVIFGLMAPWSAFIPAALVHAHDHDDAEGAPLRSDRFVLAFFWTTFIFFTLSRSRRNYYILPILPAAAIMIARVFCGAQKDLGESARRLMKIGHGLILAAAALSIVVLLPPRMFLPRPYSLLPMAPERGIFAACWIASLSAAAYVLRYRPYPHVADSLPFDPAQDFDRPRSASAHRLRFAPPGPERILLSVGVISYLLMFYLFIVAMPAGDQWRPEKSFAKTIGRMIDGHPSALASFKTQPPMFYLGLTKPVPEYDTVAQLKSAVRSGQIKWIVSRQRDIPSLDFPVHIAAFEVTYPWDSREHRLNALVLMQAGR